MIFYKMSPRTHQQNRCVYLLTVCKHNAVSAPKSLHISTYSKCKHNAVSVPCFYDGWEVKTPQVLLAGSCPSTVWNTSLTSFCLQTQVPVNPEGVFQPSFRWVLKMYVLSSKSSILIYSRIQSVHVALFYFNNVSYIVEKEIGFKFKLFLLIFNVQTLFFRPVEPLYKRVATFKLYVLPLSQFGKK